MRIVHLAAGAAGGYCGACTRDLSLVRGLIERGHDVVVVPLYTPLRVDGADPSVDRVFLGGINAYLQQRVGLLRGQVPRWIDRWLDHPGLLRLVSRLAVDVRPERLGALTVGVLAGESGPQRRELHKLLAYLGSGPRPDVLSITNSLLSAVAPAVRQALGCPVVCHLQGEESFVARLGEPHRTQAWEWLRAHAAAVDLYIAPSADYAAESAARLGVAPERVAVVPPSVDTRVFVPGAAAGPAGPSVRVGFLSRLSPDKGLDLVVEAFVQVARQAPQLGASLAVAGEARGPDARFVLGLRRRLDAGSLGHLVQWVGGPPDLPRKVRFLQACDVFCLPSRLVERRPMAALEAMACGVPAVLSDRGLHAELIRATGGGLLVPADDAVRLADALLQLLGDRVRRQELGRRAAEGTGRAFGQESASALYEAVLRSVCGT